MRFVNKKRELVERFLGLVQVEDTTSLTLKEAIQSLLIKYQLLLSKVRGQISIDEVNTELLRCMASFSPANSFSAFNVENLVKLAGFYPHDFDFEEMNQLHFQLHHYINDVRNDENFKNLRSLAELSMMLIKQGKVARYKIVYKLLKLVLVLPVATAGVERVFSIMNLIKNKRRSKMGQKYLNGCLVTLIEREFFMQAKNKDIIAHFQSIKDRKVIL